jgi:hypothetical protein
MFDPSRNDYHAAIADARTKLAEATTEFMFGIETADEFLQELSALGLRPHDLSQLRETVTVDSIRREFRGTAVIVGKKLLAELRQPGCRCSVAERLRKLMTRHGVDPQALGMNRADIRKLKNS